MVWCGAVRCGAKGANEEKVTRSKAWWEFLLGAAASNFSEASI